LHPMGVRMELKENYTKVDNVFFEYLMTLKPNEIKVLLYIIRNTVGYHRSEFESNYSKIGEGCLIDRRNVKIALETLVNIKVIKIDKSYKHNFYIVFDRQKLKLKVLDECL